MQMRTFSTYACMIIMSFSLHAAAVISPLDQATIRERWQTIFDRQLDQIEEDLTFVADDEELRDIVWLLKRAAVLADRMLAFDIDDIRMALNIMAIAEEDPTWQLFLRYKDEASLGAYLQNVKKSLSAYVAPDCRLSWPPQLEELDIQMVQVGLDERVFIVRVRQAFLTYTCIVSKILLLLQAEQA